MGQGQTEAWLLKWMEDKIVDALHNTKPVLEKYMKQQTLPMNDKELAAFNNKVANFWDITKNWSMKEVAKN